MIRLNEILKERGLTKAQLAELLGTSPQYVSNCLSGKGRYRFGLDMLEKISGAIGVPMWQMFASPEEAAADCGFVAFVKDRGAAYQAGSLEELKGIVAMLEAGAGADPS